ncbi:MAG: hypothetical protein A3G34_01070 [Candidatus Lindowbacteria bacterium RIFCSPLOWO2_12_FULL_62_27]|nr:MAG: hypothetical protein A3G34_01070 [Candidatus Lindowbacteria bacterium RIFCSPLOWO2_12_FULL_62_27]OGH58271.1 MAG: hypothetical protein A3I06_01285 [Candidatus Lindowbacteria bacterium RIFCSPLOWO2_02_FULL_62_12]
MAEEKKTEQEAFEEGDEPISPEELDERRQFMDEVFEDLGILKHKDIEISSTAYPGQLRNYYVEELEKVHVPGKRGFISAIRLINKKVPEIYQPTLKYPTDTVKCRKDGSRTTYTLIYSYDPSVLHSFRHIYKKNKPDMCIYIRFSD